MTETKQLMTPDEAMDYLVRMGKGSIDNGGEYMPTVVVQHTNTDMEIAVLAIDGNPAEYLELSLMAFAGEPLHLASFTVDSYKAAWGQERLTAERAKGPISLQAHFEAGDPLVAECLMVYAVFMAEGRVTTRGVSMTYRRDGDEIVWLETNEMADGELVGRVIGTLSAAVVLSHQAG